MSVGVRSVTLTSGYQTRGNREIWDLANEAVALMNEAQASSDPQQRFQLLQRALAKRTRELQEWTVLEDMIGQSLACMGIANVHFMTTKSGVGLSVLTVLENARTWYERALAHLEGLHDDEAAKQRAIVRGNVMTLELFACTRLLHKEVRVRELVNASHYNGRTGKVEELIDPYKYKVRLYAVVSRLPEAEGLPEVFLNIHERNLVVVCESEQPCPPPPPMEV